MLLNHFLNIYIFINQPLAFSMWPCKCIFRLSFLFVSKGHWSHLYIWVLTGSLVLFFMLDPAHNTFKKIEPKIVQIFSQEWSSPEESDASDGSDDNIEQKLPPKLSLRQRSNSIVLEEQQSQENAKVLNVFGMRSSIHKWTRQLRGELTLVWASTPSPGYLQSIWREHSEKKVFLFSFSLGLKQRANWQHYQLSRLGVGYHEGFWKYNLNKGPS